MRHWYVVLLMVGLAACSSGDDDTKSDIPIAVGDNVPATQTRAAELSELATVRAGAGASPATQGATKTTEPTAATNVAATAEEQVATRSVERTATAAARPTNTPRPTATATPEPKKADLTLAQWHRIEKRYSSGVTIVGVIVNNGTGTAGDISIVASVFDANGAILGSAKAYTVMPIIPASGKSPFEIRILDVDPTLVDDSKTKVEGQFSTLKGSDFEAGYYNLDIGVPQIQWTADSIAGQLQNNSTATVEGAYILVVGYDGSGNVIDVEQGHADLDQLSPGQISPFTINLYQDEPVPASFEYVTYARNQT